MIFKGHLGFTIRTQVGDNTLLPYEGKASGKPVRQRYGHGHEFFCLIAGKTYHHSLVSSPDLVYLGFVHIAFPDLEGFIDSLGDVTGLFINGRQDCAGITVKSIFCPSITYLLNDIPRQTGNIDIGGSTDLSCNHYQTSSYECFTCYTAHRVICKNGIEYSIRYLISDFIRMPLSNRFR